MGQYRNVGETALKFPGHPPYVRGDRFQADLSPDQERQLVAGGSLQVIEPSAVPDAPEPGEPADVHGPLGPGDDATPDRPKAPMTVPKPLGAGENPSDRPVQTMAPVRGPLGPGDTPPAQLVPAVERPPSAPLPTKTPVTPPARGLVAVQQEQQE